MKNSWISKSKGWLAAGTLVVAAAATIPVMAQPAQGGGTRAAGPGFGGRGGPFLVLRGLELSDAQREQIRSITQERRAEADGPQRRLVDLNRQLHLAILAESPDGQKVEELKTAIAAAANEELTARIDVQTRIAQVLTPEQRAKAREARAKGAPGGRVDAAGRRGARQ